MAAGSSGLWRRVRPRQHERRPLAVSRTDGAEQIGVAIALEPIRPGTRSPPAFPLAPGACRRNAKQSGYPALGIDDAKARLDPKFFHLPAEAEEKYYAQKADLDMVA